ncbi:hypothetical protein NP233_g11403 [Leucocoprinus birnbaumii]|uniref:F-box domain-containing protein n=1 Tax=Leucocoprinus birnbaumii TaxID=56174 RepID=A0AAD5VJ08_9AGAR|nr:hypothetical protein NP233_g11403 [Leucocoprinus birnbaumii]
MISRLLSFSQLVGLVSGSLSFLLTQSIVAARMPTFNDLPSELLEEIVDFAIHFPLPPLEERTPVPRLKRLRLVSRRMNEAVSPRLAARFRIWVFARPISAQCDEICVDLAAGVPTFLQHLTVLNIHMMKIIVPDVRPWSNLLESLFSTLPTIRAVRWTHKPTELKKYPEAFIPGFLQSISSLQNLSELSISVDDDGDSEFIFPLEPIPRLRTFRISWDSIHPPSPQILSRISHVMTNCIKLENFSFIAVYPRYSGWHTPVTFAQLFDAVHSESKDMVLQSLNLRGVIVRANEFKQHLRHFRCLLRLEMRYDPSPSAAINSGEVLQILGESRIFLTDVVLDTIHHPGVFGYLSSYSTLERLELQPRDQLDDSPHIVNTFFTSVLAAQSSSLRRLTISGYRWSHWGAPLSSEQLALLQKCRSLECIYCLIAIPDDNSQGGLKALVSLWSTRY